MSAAIEKAADAISAVNSDAPVADLPPDLAKRRRQEARAAVAAFLDFAKYEHLNAGALSWHELLRSIVQDDTQ